MFSFFLFFVFSHSYPSASIHIVLLERYTSYGAETMHSICMSNSLLTIFISVFFGFRSCVSIWNDDLATNLVWVWLRHKRNCIEDLQTKIAALIFSSLSLLLSHIYSNVLFRKSVHFIWYLFICIYLRLLQFIDFVFFFHHLFVNLLISVDQFLFGFIWRAMQ